MKINIPKVVIPVPMSEYAPELQGNALHVWVNPPMQILQAYRQLLSTLQAHELESARQMLEIPATKEERSPLMRAYDQALHWINRRKEEKTEGVSVDLLEWYANIWSQGPADTQWTVEELRTLEESDPAFLSWMIAQTWKARGEHMEQKKKV
jgi:hypothetical protein